MNVNDIRKAWRTPNQYHHGITTWWYPLDEADTYRCICMQDVDIVIDPYDTLGYPVPVKDRYIVKVQFPDYTEAVETFDNVRGFGDLRNRACRWIASLTRAYERGECVDAA